LAGSSINSMALQKQDEIGRSAPHRSAGGRLRYINMLHAPIYYIL
jgi:hypothetical protein